MAIKTITNPTDLDLMPVGTIAETATSRFTKQPDYLWLGEDGIDYDSREFAWLAPTCEA